jgi:hypothetical protein
MKTIYHVNVSLYGEWDMFFDANYKLMHCWCINDAMYRPEYMNPLMKALGYKIVDLDENDPKIKKDVILTLIKMGYELGINE